MSIIEKMNDLFGSKYQIVSQNGEPIVLSNFEMAEQIQGNVSTKKTYEFPKMNEPHQEEESNEPPKKTVDDYVFQIYLGSLTVVGLFVLFRMIQKSR
jgi:hypothetical protein